MAKAALSDSEFRPRETVVTIQDLPGIPVGTEGRVELRGGLTWTRYRVKFDNGEDRGSIDPSFLARPKDFDRRREELANRAATAVVATDGGGDAEDEVDAGESKVVNGVTVPARLLAMSKRARERLAAG